ncbi:sensor histidine kinase [Streptomyces sp. RP5T]|uniref:sensor histidine kinase n=1 Tax=unclassified Streptomyces TaxID=2593676 RepID=UPI00163A9044|nr:sensor histidine kinase [Streptomyces sp. RP5T]
MRMRRVLFIAALPVVLGLLGVLPRPTQLDLAVTVSVVLCALALMGQGWGRYPRWRREDPAEEPEVPPAVGERLVAAREDERNRLRDDLHDSVGPALAGIRLRLDVAAERVAQPATRQLILDAAAETRRTVDDIRRIIDDLRPPELESEGLEEALLKLVHRAGVGGELEVHAQLPCDGPVRGLSFATELAAFRIVGEALTNVVRHARARTATVRLTEHDNAITLEVTDDGVGPPVGKARRRGVGLASMARRAEDVGGRCEVLPRPDGAPGTLVRVTLPRGEA